MPATTVTGSPGTVPDSVGYAADGDFADALTGGGSPAGLSDVNLLSCADTGSNIEFMSAAGGSAADATDRLSAADLNWLDRLKPETEQPEICKPHTDPEKTPLRQVIPHRQKHYDDASGGAAAAARRALGARGDGSAAPASAETSLHPSAAPAPSPAPAPYTSPGGTMYDRGLYPDKAPGGFRARMCPPDPAEQRVVFRAALGVPARPPLGRHSEPRPASRLTPGGGIAGPPARDTASELPLPPTPASRDAASALPLPPTPAGGAPTDGTEGRGASLVSCASQAASQSVRPSQVSKSQMAFVADSTADREALSQYEGAPLPSTGRTPGDASYAGDAEDARSDSMRPPPALLHHGGGGVTDPAASAAATPASLSSQQAGYEAEEECRAGGPTPPARSTGMGGSGRYAAAAAKRRRLAGGAAPSVSSLGTVDLAPAGGTSSAASMFSCPSWQDGEAAASVQVVAAPSQHDSQAPPSVQGTQQDGATQRQCGAVNDLFGYGRTPDRDTAAPEREVAKPHPKMNLYSPAHVNPSEWFASPEEESEWDRQHAAFVKSFNAYIARVDKIPL